MMTLHSHEAVEMYRRGLRDLPREHGFEILDVQGALPADLTGTLYCNGPGLFSLFGRPYRHWFDGDGAITAIRFGAGGAVGAVRLVESRELLAERVAGRALFTSGSTLAPQWHRRLGMRFKNPANTKPLVWDERVFALYEGGLPTEIDPASLGTSGETDLQGVVRGGFSAHFHEVPSRSCIYNFSVQRGRRNVLHLYEMPAGGKVRCLGSLPLPQSSSMLHDFVATEKHLVFFIPPVRVQVLPVMLGIKAPLDTLQWRPQDGTTILVVPIDAPECYRRFEVDAFFQYHFLNAYEAGNSIVVDFVRVADFENAFKSHELDECDREPATEGRLFRAFVHPEQRTVRMEQRWDIPCEFPQVAPAVVGRPHRFGYVVAADEKQPQTRISKIDVTDGLSVSTQLGNHCFPSEPIFVPRPGAVDEDDGYLLSLTYDADSDRSFVAVLDARRLARGPMASVWFDHHVPRPLHGTWHGCSA